MDSSAIPPARPADIIDSMFHGAPLPKQYDDKRIRVDEDGDAEAGAPRQGVKRKADNDPADDNYYFTGVDGQRYKRLKKNTFPLFTDGMDYLGSCVRIGMEFHPDEARFHDALANIHFKDCYGCAYFERTAAYISDVIEHAIESCCDEPDDPDDAEIRRRCRQYLKDEAAGVQPFDPTEGGMDYARFCGESGSEAFDVAKARTYDEAANYETLSDDQCYRCYAVRARMRFLEKQEKHVHALIKEFYVKLDS